MSVGLVLTIFAICIAVMIIMIAKFNVNAVTSLLLVSIVLGLLLGTPPGEMEGVINGAFSSTIKSVAVVILLGCILGKMLEETGAAQAICTSAIKIVGKKNVIWAIGFSAFVLGIPVFSDTVTILLISIVSKLAVETGGTMMALGSALGVGAQITHALVPPTPGPLAAANALGVPMGQAIGWGLVVSFPSLITTILFCKYCCTQMVHPKDEYMKAKDDERLPSTTIAYMPIVIPLALIIISSVITNTMPEDSSIVGIASFIGSPITALIIGCMLAMILTGSEWNSKKVLNDWVDESMASAAMPLFVTGMGGAMAQFVKNAGVADKIAEAVVAAGLPSLLLPILLAVLIHVATGSTTLAVLTAANLTAPMLETLGISAVAAFLACAAGSIILKHGNSSAFWVACSMSNMSFTQGLIGIGGGCTVAGVTACIITFILNAVGVI